MSPIFFTVIVEPICAEMIGLLRALVASSHPKYFALKARTRVSDFVAAVKQAIPPPVSCGIARAFQQGEGDHALFSNKNVPAANQTTFSTG